MSIVYNKENIKIKKISKFNVVLKRSFDIFVSFMGLIVTAPIIIISAVLVKALYGEPGFFTQNRVGMNGKEFKIIKIRSMTNKIVNNTNVTTDNDPRITKLGKFFRKTKIDELPQLINVLKGEMSFVGPRPDVKELIETIPKNKKDIFLSIRPGITGPASIKYKNEESILASVDDAETYNKEIIFPDKVEINEEYIEDYSLVKDIKYIVNTVIS